MSPTARSKRPTATCKRWLLAAESARARICALDNYNNIAVEIEDLVQPSSRLRGRALTTDREGRSFDSAGQGRHRVENSSDVRLGPVGKFARLLAERLEQGRLHGEFEDVIIAAPPRFLGMVRKQLSPETAKRVKLEIRKNLVSEDHKGLRKAVMSGLAITR
ncbi:MAG: host attachment protein [Gammaproteobacteria bacterium]